MEQATEKQINFAKQLGIENPERHSKIDMKILIDDAIKARDGVKTNTVAPQQAFNPITDVPRHEIVISRVEKPHSYEFGAAGARHKVYYGEVVELEEHMASLKQAGLMPLEIEDTA